VTWAGPAVVTPYTVPAALMDVLQVMVLVLAAAGATVVVAIREPVRQVIALSAYGLVLAILFLAFQAPDVTLSELTVGAVLLPVLLLLTLMKVRRREEGDAGSKAAGGPARGAERAGKQEK
jgi:energy-converting hydrogenase B subunit D